MERKAFLDQEPPPGYVAGVGRGATGFTTSADTGPVRFESLVGDELEIENEGHEAGVLAQTVQRSTEDDEADRIYDEIDRRMASRLKRRGEDRNSVEPTQSVEIPIGTGSIQREFTLLKSELARVSMEEWENLPEVGDLTRKNKRQRLLDQQHQRVYAAPDLLISGAGSGLKDRPESSVSIGNNEVNAALLSEIDEWEQKTAMNGNLEKGRSILASLRKAEPYKADLWISSARLEEQARHFQQARLLIKKGCDVIPHNDQIWLENIRLHRSEGTKTCKAIMSEALRLNSESEALWFAAINLENPGDVISRRKITMKALEFLPSNANLWKALIDMDASDDEKIRLLTRATELCPSEWDLWLTLVNISSYGDAKAVLNKARKQLPKEAKVWITALKLEERENSHVSPDKLRTMLTKGIRELTKQGVIKSHSDWLKDAIKAQEEDFAKTAQAIVRSTLETVDDDESIRGLAEVVLPANTAVASYVYQFIAERHPKSTNNWTKLFGLLKSDTPRLYQMYELAIASNPESEVLQLMYAKDKWLLSSDIPTARSILEAAGNAMPHSEKVWVARIKLEVRNHEFSQALAISKEAVDRLLDASPRIWYKHIHILRYCFLRHITDISVDLILRFSQNALDLFPGNPKLYLQRSQILVESGDKTAARECLSIGTKMCPESPLIWLSLARLDLELSAGSRARSVLDSAISRFPEEPSLWEAKIKLEFDLKDFVTARQLINRGLRKFPTSSQIWILHLKNIPKMSHRKNAFLDALKQTNNSTSVLLAIGFFFWIDGKHAKAKAWFERALNSSKANGDAWGWMYCFQKRYGTEADVNELVNNCSRLLDDINTGETWNSIVKHPDQLGDSPVQLLEKVAEALTSTLIRKFNALKKHGI